MFTLLRNFRTMFILTVANYNLDAPSGPTEAEARLAEAREITESTRESLMDLQAAVTYFSEEDATLDKTSRSTNAAVTRDIQELLTLVSLSTDNSEISPGRADGDFYNGTERALNAFLTSIGMEANGIVTAEVHQRLLEASLIESYVNSIQAAETSERETAISVVAGFNVETDSDDEAKVMALQEALNALGANLTVDGDFGPASTRALEAAQADVQEAEYSNAIQALEEAQRASETAERALDTAMERFPDSVEEQVLFLQAEIAELDQTIGMLIREKDSLPRGPQESIDTEISRLLEIRASYQEMLEGANNGENILNPATIEAVDAGTTADAAETELEAIQQDIADQATVYSRLEMDDTPTAEELKTLLAQDSDGGILLSQLQVDLKLLGHYSGAIDGHNGVNSAFGPGTTRAVEAALQEYGSLIAIRRAARLAEVRAESERNTGSGRTNRGIDIVAQDEGYEAGDLEAFLAEHTCPEHMPENVREGTPEMQQAWIIGQAIEMGDRENTDRTRLTLIDGLAQAGNDRILEVMTELRANFETIDGQAEIIQAMSNGVDLTSEDFARGEVGAQDYQALELGGRIIDAGLLDSAYIATGSDQTTDIDGTRQRGTMEVPIWNPDGSINERFAELDFANATYINGAIVMTVKNGCEGNLVIIPVQRERYVPPVAPVSSPVVHRTPSTPANPEHPPVIIVPENDLETGVRRECDNHGNWVATTWEETGNTIFFGSINTTRDTGSTILIPNAHQCNGGGDNDDNSRTGNVSTTPGTEGGGDEGGGGTGGGNDGDRG